MKHFLPLLLLLLSGAAAQAQRPSTPQLTVTEHQLSNGMTVWLNEDHSQPVVYGSVVVKAGAKDCPGTGIAHYFEHILFKGTDRLGTVDYASEKVYLDSISVLYDRLAETRDAAERAALQQDINRLSGLAAQYAIPNEFNRLVTRYGGTGLNAATSYDMTFYYNTFPARYLEQWSLLYSERLLRPVYRLFQGELETVYEEKNRGDDNLFGSVLETVTKAIFQDRPYASPVIGTTENLKNPRMSEMDAFFKRYYVGCNMGIILAGDIDPTAALPILERTFGRIERGTPPERQLSPLPPIHGQQELTVRIPIPVVSARGLLFRAPTDYEADANALDIGLQLLSNGSSGLLDSLMNESKVLAALSMRMALNDAGVAGYLVVPNLLGSTKKAIAAVQEQVARLQRGEFSDAQFEAAKLDAIRKAELAIETPADRAQKMIEVMSSGHSWQEYLQLVAARREVTRNDAIAALRKYFGSDYYLLRKKYGKPPKDRLQQPGYKPVVPRHIDEQSAFARELAALPAPPQAPRAIDFEHAATQTSLSQHATLYTVSNPVNDLFRLELRYSRGSLHDPLLPALATYLEKTGTDSLTHQQWQRSLYELGVTSSIECNKNSFSFILTGPDTHLTPALRLLGHLLTRAQHNPKALKDLVDEAKLNASTFEEDNTEVTTAVMSLVRYGQASPYLQQLNKQQAKALTGEKMLSLLSELTTHACTLLYSGTHDAATVSAAIRSTLPIARAQVKQTFIVPTYQTVNEPLVYLYDLPSARQTYVCSYETVGAQPTLRGKVCFDLLADYLGGGMSSVLFQEMREFRSLAYNTQAVASYAPNALYPDRPMTLCTVTSTQADKAMQATALLDSLLRSLPMRATNYETARASYESHYRNAYPTFRDMGSYIHNSRLYGYTSDPAPEHITLAEGITFDDLQRYYRDAVAGNSAHRCLILVGNVKKMDLAQLERYGRIVMLKKEQVINK